MFVENNTMKLLNELPFVSLASYFQYVGANDPWKGSKFTQTEHNENRTQSTQPTFQIDALLSSGYTIKSLWRLFRSGGLPIRTSLHALQSQKS